MELLKSVLLFVLGHPVSSFSTAQEALYFGSGCFWGRQYDFAETLERGRLGRNDDEITSVSGYAGSSKPGGKASKGDFCYYNEQNISVYSDFGYAEVVQVQLNSSELQAAFQLYFGSFVNLGDGIWGREDYFDVGAAYRSVLGFPGGFTNAGIMAVVHAANLHNMTLRPGDGSDPDTLANNEVFVMDSNKFLFHQAELCLQFRNNQTGHYPEAYHALKEVLLKDGRLRKTACPANYICNATIADLHLSESTNQQFV
eukprot:gnl/MRDRNA2_/MRDRNA2_69962_c0_seq1.p1 gnl/MRDRNA2_/MRDRNA2_69962_c0~~gnl/MRDRNA2_/MRDRNA2_69962_c0_seq1.p1  ORF type:complete len:256 (-),score=48.97 gnl/MRDRNA2_/MRDRNA2_69962_c0_seq1:39-806(-)